MLRLIKRVLSLSSKKRRPKECQHEFTGYQNGYPYFKVQKRGHTDGIGREHVQVYAECDKCEKIVQIGLFHKPKEWKQN